MLYMTVVMIVGVLGLVVLDQFSDALAGTKVATVLRELALSLVAAGIALVLLNFLFQALLAKKAVPRILADVLLVLLLIGFVLYRMNASGVNLAGIITTSAVITGVIAFSLQETLGNLWGGIALQLDNTCRLGDWIRIEGVTGQIVSIRWRCLVVATNDGETVIIRGGTREEPKRTHLADVAAPNYFGEIGLLTGQARTATVIAKGDVLCYRLERAGFDAILRARPELAVAMSQTVTERQAANDATLRALSEEARARQASGRTADLVRRIQTFFGLSH